MSQKASPTRVGAFVVVGIAIAVVATAVLGSGRYFRETEHFVVYFRDSVNGLRTGAPVKFKGIEIGRVEQIRLNISELRDNPKETRLPIIIEIDEDQIDRHGGDVDLADRDTLKRLIDKGLRAQLKNESLVTGVRYIALDMKPGTKAHFVNDSTVEYPEIPVVPEATEEIQEDIMAIADGLAAVDYEKLGQTVDGLARSLREVSDSVNGVVEGDLLVELQEMMAEIKEAARSLRLLSEHLSRDPGSLLRGGPQ